MPRLRKWDLLINLLPSANEVCEGYVFTGVCLSTGGCPGPGPGGCLPGVCPGPGQGGLPRGMSRPRPGWVCPGGCPGPGPWGVSRPRPGGCSPACTEADTPLPPPSRTLLLQTVRIPLECILVFTSIYCTIMYLQITIYTFVHFIIIFVIASYFFDLGNVQILITYFKMLLDLS